MFGKQAIAAIALLAGCAAAGAQQQLNKASLSIDANNRTLAVSAAERVTLDPEIAVLHIGFETLPSDAKSAHAAGAKTSNEIVAALKQAGIPETSIRSESQDLQSEWDKPHKFKLVQQWTVEVPPERAAEILDIAISAGANDSGQIDWTVKDVRALEDEALDRAAARANADGAALAKGMGVHLGSLLYVTNQVSVPEYNGMESYSNAPGGGGRGRAQRPLAIEPRKVSRTATVYAVFSIE